MKVLLYEGNDNSLLETDWNTIPSVGDCIYLTQIRKRTEMLPAFQRRKFRVIMVNWSITLDTLDKFYSASSENTYVQIHLEEIK